MIPYFQLPSVHLLGLTVHPFTWLILSGMVVCFFLGQRRVRTVGLYPPFSAVALLWVAVGGFVGAHVFEVVAYYPERLVQQGPASLLAIWDGISSFGGFIGGTIALWLHGAGHGVWMLPYLDALLYGFAPGWILARGGCFVSHDHLGLRSSFFLAVAYADGPRHNLGLYEMLLAAAITVVLYALRRGRFFVGFHTALVLWIYAPARFGFDLLRTDDRRYFGLTPAQYLCGVMLAIATYLTVQGRAREPACADQERSTGEQS